MIPKYDYPTARKPPQCGAGWRGGVPNPTNHRQPTATSFSFFTENKKAAAELNMFPASEVQRVSLANNKQLLLKINRKWISIKKNTLTHTDRRKNIARRRAAAHKEKPLTGETGGKKCIMY